MWLSLVFTPVLVLLTDGKYALRERFSDLSSQLNYLLRFFWACYFGLFTAETNACLDFRKGLDLNNVKYLRR